MTTAAAVAPNVMAERTFQNLISCGSFNFILYGEVQEQIKCRDMDATPFIQRLITAATQYGKWDGKSIQLQNATLIRETRNCFLLNIGNLTCSVFVHF